MTHFTDTCRVTTPGCPDALTFDWRRCQDKFDQLVSLVAHQLPACVPHRHKRSILPWLDGEVIQNLQRFGASATNWLLGLSNLAAESNTAILALDLASKLWQHTVAKYTNNTLVPADHCRRNIFQVSEAAELRPEVVDEYFARRDGILKLVEYVDDKMDAALILVKSMLYNCRKGILDTKALGELLSSETLSNLEPETTIIRSITHDAKRALMDISFEVVHVRGFLERLNLPSLLVGVALLAIMVMLGITSRNLRNKLKRIDETQARHGGMVDSSLADIRSRIGSIEGMEFPDAPPPEQTGEGQASEMHLMGNISSGGVGTAVKRGYDCARVYASPPSSTRM